MCVCLFGFEGRLWDLLYKFLIIAYRLWERSGGAMLLGKTSSAGESD